MATFHEMKDESGREVVRCFVKGAPDQLLARAGTVSTTPTPARSQPMRSSPSATGRRTSASASKAFGSWQRLGRDFPVAEFDATADLLPLMQELELLALVGIVDPPRPSAKASIATAKSAGIKTRMITGDHAVTAAAIARELGIDGRRDHRRRVRAP